MRNILIICAAAFGLISCDKTEGEGGTSVIQGQVYKIFTFQNPTTGLLDTSYFQLDAGKDVFIIYGQDKDELYDDKFETDYNGKYHFEYLRKGEYIIYTYSDSIDNSNVKYDYPVFKQISISSNNSSITVDDFIIEKNQ
jgi:hypothetical protein